MPQTLVVFSCDEAFFPLARGLVLSLLRGEFQRQNIGLAFIDVGCSPASLAWLQEQGVQVTRLESGALGPLSNAAAGYRSALVCRPLLPKLFPGVEAFVWLDCDLWVQTPKAVSHLAKMANAQRDRVFACPEWHYSYSNLNQNFVSNHIRNFGSYYRAAYDERVAGEMAARPMLNAGVFAMAAASPFWEMWWNELVQVYQRDGGRNINGVLHMADQITLNVLAHRTSCAVHVDPQFNYMCIWGMPFRDGADTVRVALPPGNPLDIIHLAQWRILGKTYLEQGLLYQRGNYLTFAERDALLTGR